jgi:uncharacterized protein DUF4160/uncharacterized protein DUF2442
MYRALELPRVTAVRHVGGHVLWLEFSDGLSGELDLASDLVGPVFEPLRDPREFARVRLGAESVEWPNGADWAPESLHARLSAVNGLPAEPNAADSGASPDHDPRVPELSRFYGIVITMYFQGHAMPHFHARCGGQSIAIEIDGDGLRGSFPPNRLPLVFAWRDLHRDELRANWDRLREGREPEPIAPLE